jgi:D-psicose/D-tagatose/L-ribulose 3-epimerase
VDIWYNKSKAKKENMMKFGLMFAYWTRQWDCDFIHLTKKAKAAGLDILEVSASALLDMSDSELTDLKKCGQDLGIGFTSNLGPPKDKDVSSKDPAVRKAGVEYMINIMKKMDLLGTKQLAGVSHSYWPCDFDDLDKEAVWARGVQGVKAFSKVAVDLGITIAIEVVNRFDGFVLNTAQEGVQFCKDVDNKNVKLLLDTFHMNIEEADIPQAIRYADQYVAQMHVSEGNRDLPGNGPLPWSEIGQALRDIKFDGPIIMEPVIKMGGEVAEAFKIFRDISQGADEAMMDKKVTDAVNFLKEAFVK